MPLRFIYHIYKTSEKSLCGKPHKDILGIDMDYDQILKVVEEANGFISLCKICESIKKKEEKK
jgi:hypothetical protein